MGSTSDKVYIVDGYNVLRCGPCYEHLTGPDWTDDSFNLAREMLLNDVTLLVGKEATATIIYDGTRNEFSTGKAQKVGPVSIIFSVTGKDADQTVIELARKARLKTEKVTVISSDASVQNSVMGHGVARMSSRDFCRECNALRQQVAEDLTVKPPKKSTVGSTIPEDVLSKLKNLRDSL
ncbi:MAG: NYN domain-containing protein [Phoenicibacter congonensis]|uniref:NYN domain-containing protein n=1 Tax=Phoenicibacter congonensis TaxID=1944646 RepID=A0AA43U9Q6_9ACTN|nr:NYN domain-containing protein [Phoenicibacter congonensis]